MVNKRSTAPLYILQNGELVGELLLTKSALRFNYAESWLAQPGARPLSLSLPLTTRFYEGEVVYNFFDNLLPDNPRIRARIQAQFQIPSTHPFDLLAHIGKDCVGAIQLSHEPSSVVQSVQTAPLVEHTIAEILRNYQNAPLGMMRDQTDFRISIAGVQEKSAFLYYQNKWCCPLGGTPTSHIFKLPIGLIPYQSLDLSESCENEWLCSEIANAYGFNVAQCEIQTFEDIKVLIVERFDRKWSETGTYLMRLPQEDCCQALGYSSNLKYQADGGPGIAEIMKLLLGAKTAMYDRTTFFRAQVLFFLLAAIDGHAKNFSVFLQPWGRYQLAPLYDMMSAYPLMAKGALQAKKIKMAMALKGKNNHYRWAEIQHQHFLSTAKAVQFSVTEATKILEEMLETVDHIIAKVTSKIPKDFPEQIASSIFTGMQMKRDELHLLTR